MEPRFRNANNDLSKYSFLCGYVQRKEQDGRYKEIYMEHRHYHVKSGEINKRYEIWECFDNNLTKARAFYNSIDLRTWDESETFMTFTDAKRCQRFMQKAGLKTKLEPHIGIAYPYYNVYWKRKE